MWEVEFRDENGDWYMETARGTRTEVLERYAASGYVVLKIRG